MPDTWCWCDDRKTCRDFDPTWSRSVDAWVCCTCSHTEACHAEALRLAFTRYEDAARADTIGPLHGDPKCPTQATAPTQRHPRP